MDLYLSEDEEDQKCDIMNYWKSNSKRFPKLCKMAVTYLALPASSVPVERMFSIAGKVFTLKKCYKRPPYIFSFLFRK